ncbi:endospore germination permease [Paenibacillus macerans]|uniref:GerAB/ArcD/ProY family transporter n=1 Tax=Paenibacillus macerans TaxID=44252 RepID=UPI002E1BFAE8|nr:endospore germination permease [Paenibacillus macerans]
MVEKGKISSGQFALILYSLMGYDGLLLIPKIAGEAAGRDLWLSPVWSHLAGIAFVLAMLQLGRMFPGETSIAYSKRVLGKLPGKAAGFIIVFYTAYLTSVILRIYSDFISSVFLENTPSLVTAGGIMFLVAYTVRGGVEVLGRLAQLFLPVTIVVFALLSILTIPEWNVSNALPIMGNGPVPSLKGAIVPFTWFSGYLLLGLYFPLLSNQRKAAFFVLTAWFGEMITLAASGLVSVFLFGEYAGTLNYPFIEVVRYIGLGEFFQHIDALLLAVWLPGTFIELAAYFYAAVTGMAEWIGLKDYRALAFPLGFLALVVSFWGLSGAADFAHYLATSHVWFDFSLVVFGFILFLTAWIRSKLGALKPNRVPYADQDPAPVAATIVHHEEHAEHAHAESGSASHSHAGAVATSRDLCPSCGSASLINIEGCKTCSNCGHSQCYF